MSRRGVSAFSLVLLTVSALAVHAQTLPPRPPPPSPALARAVLIGQNSIQIDRDTVIVRGDVIVNDVATTPVAGESELSLDRGVTTPAGYRIAANGIDIDGGAIVGGAAHYNTLNNAGTINGPQLTPLALPVLQKLPPPGPLSQGTDNIVVPENGTLDLDSGEYASLVVGRNATLRFTGGGYLFTSVSVDRGGALHYLAPTQMSVAGNLSLSTNCTIGPAPNTPMTAASIFIQVQGTSMTAGSSSSVRANILLPTGSLTVGQQFDGAGSFIAYDIRIGRDSRFTLESSLNQPPVADPQSVFTNGTAPVTITLTATDPENTPLQFSIISAPAQGSLSPVVSQGPNSAQVTYTATSAGDLTDAFTFRAIDAGGRAGEAVVSINPSGDTAPPPPTTVDALDDSHGTQQDTPVHLLLRALAPPPVNLQFSIVSGSGPTNGTLGQIMPGPIPGKTAVVLYTPNAGFSGTDSFQFTACGIINAVQVCDTATFTIDVRAPEPPPNLAEDIEVSTASNAPVAISLIDSTSSSQSLTLLPKAAFIDLVEIAGNVADANNDGIGDNVNILPGSAPVFMHAGRGLSGGPGSNGTVYMQFEWDISGFNGSIGALVSAHVSLPTHRGTTDAIDTHFFAASVDGDGLLTNADFATPAERIPGVVMVVPPLADMPVGTDGSFSFDVYPWFKQAIESGRNYFVIQGRVPPTAVGRGLQVRTTATPNGQSVPALSLATPGAMPPRTATITSLPQFGTLRDSENNLITSVPHMLSNSTVTYTPNNGFVGNDQFGFNVSDGFTVDSATVTIHVIMPDCATDPAGCVDGR